MTTLIAVSNEEGVMKFAIEDPGMSMSEALERITGVWNACSGIPTDDLKDHVFENDPSRASGLGPIYRLRRAT